MDIGEVGVFKERKPGIRAMRHDGSLVSRQHIAQWVLDNGGKAFVDETRLLIKCRKNRHRRVEADEYVFQQRDGSFAALAAETFESLFERVTSNAT